MAIRKSKDLSAVLGKPEEITIGRFYSSLPTTSFSVRAAHGGTGLHAPKYHLVTGDLRKSPSELIASLEPHLSSAHPTILLFECVLVYMSPEASSALIQAFANYLEAGNSVLGGIVYEMYGLEDSFGRVMKSNLMVSPVCLCSPSHV